MASASTVATPFSRSIPATVLLPQPMLPVRPMTFMGRPMLLLRLAARAEVRAALRDDDPADRPAASVARLVGAPVDHQPLGVVAGLAVGAHVVADAVAAVRDPLAEDRADGPMQPPHLVIVQGVRRAKRV